MPDDHFKNHVAKYEQRGPYLETLEWRDPDDCHYAIWYVRQLGTLMVFGDCYEATYMWNWEPRISLEWMSRLDQGYFISKCRASPHGREPYAWDRDTAEKTIREYFDEFKSPNYDEGYEDERFTRATELEKFEGYFGWRSLEGKFEWDMWCCNHGYDVFGDCYYEGVADSPGKVLGPCIAMHLKGLKAAFAQLRRDSK